jgi:hypothetical protein
VAERRKTGESRPRGRPRATTPEARERQMVSLAFDEAERQIREQKASSQVITHFLKLGTAREELERAKIERENRLLDARVQQIQDAGHMEEMLGEAMRYFTGYKTGHLPPPVDDEDDYED